MEEEYFDIVDEENRQTGEQRSRSDAHSKGLWHRTVHIYVFREKDGMLQFLVHLRSKTKDQHPNQWDTRFGGHLKAGETVAQAVAGELKDEIGITVNLKNLIKGSVHKQDIGTNKEFAYTYYYQYSDDMSNLTFNDGEVQRVQLMSESAILRSMSENSEYWVTMPKDFEEIVDLLKKIIGN